MKKLLVTILGLLIALALALALFLSVSTPWSRDKAITIKPENPVHGEGDQRTWTK